MLFSTMNKEKPRLLEVGGMDQASDYWLGLNYLMQKYRPDSLADVLRLVSVVEMYLAHHQEGDLWQDLQAMSSKK